MYKIKAGDGKEYGPIAADTLRQWVNQGRANGQTPVLPEGATQWTTLGACAEFAGLFPGTMAGVAGAAPGQPLPPAKTSGLAITSLVLGILGCTSLFGLILGFIALNKINKSGGRLGGRGVALAGVIVSGCMMVLAVILVLPAAMLVPALAKAKQRAQEINCRNNLKQLGLAVRIYNTDNKDTFPATNWCDTIINEAGTTKVFVCPGAPAASSGYAFNSKVLGLEDGKVAPNTVLIFESDAGWNASGGAELMITQPRHGTTFNVCFADGSVQQIKAEQLSTLNWDPKAKD
jgi:prepilin-type processing-associated H-X9-DG protein